MLRRQYKPKLSVKFKNKLNSESFVGDIINEESIEGKSFWVVKVNARTLKLSKDAYTIQTGNK
jgi:hypothetical protein